MKRDEAVRKAVGMTLVALRHRYGYSQEKLAEDSGMSRVHLSDLERGVRMPKVDLLLKISEGLEIPLSALARDIERNYKLLIQKP